MPSVEQDARFDALPEFGGFVHRPTPLCFAEEIVTNGVSTLSESFVLILMIIQNTVKENVFGFTLIV